MDLSKCQCQHAGWCDVFKKEMTFDPPNWQWCQSLPEDQRKSYYNSLLKSSVGKVIKKANNKDEADIVYFYDELPEKNSNYAVCVVAGNDSAMDLLNITRDSIQKYAQKCKADYIELSGNQNEDWPIANKYRIHKITSEYEKTVYIDCDIFVKDNAPDLFLTTPDDKISAYEEYDSFVDINSTQWIKNEQEIILHRNCDDDVKSRYLDNGKFKTTSMLNSGLLVIPKILADYYKQPDSPYKKFWCFDQHLLTLLLPKEKLNKLSYKFNCEYVDRNFWRRINDAYFIHVNGMIDKADYRKHLLRQFSAGDFTINYEDRFNMFKEHGNSIIKNIPTCISKSSNDIFKKNKIGLFFNNLSPGGATTWLYNFVECFKNDITGIVAIEDHPEYNDLNCGLDRGFSIDDMYELYEKSDVIIYWIYMIPGSMKYIPEFFKTNYKNKKIIFISHSSIRVPTYDYLIDMLKPDYFVCVDEYLAKLYNGICIPPFVRKLNINRKPIPKNILWHHRLEKYKGVEVLADIIEAMPDYTFHIAGSWIPTIHEPDTINIVENKILSPNIDNVFYHGEVNDMSELFSICSLSLSTSLDESFGLSVAESIVNGIPTISHSTGIGKYSDGIVPYKDYYGDWVKEIRKCEQLCKESKNQKMFEERYTMENFKYSWESIL